MSSNQADEFTNFDLHKALLPYAGVIGVSLPILYSTFDKENPFASQTIVILLMIIVNVSYNFFQKVSIPTFECPKPLDSAVLVTGSATGIGKATALALVKKGFTVFTAVRRSGSSPASDPELNAIVNGRKLMVEVLMDVGDEKTLDKGFDKMKEYCQQMGLSFVGVVNNAGVAVNAPVEVMPLDVLRQNIDTNLIGLIAVTQKSLPLLRESKSSGRIVNVSSFNGFLATPFSGAYCASKFAVEGISDSLRRELRPWKNLAVVIVQPGYIRTPIQEKNVVMWRSVFDSIKNLNKKYYASYYTDEQIQKRFEKTTKDAMQAEDVATAIVEAITAAKPKTRYMVGKDGLLARFASDFLPDYFQDYLLESKWPGKLEIVKNS